MAQKGYKNFQGSDLAQVMIDFGIALGEDPDEMKAKVAAIPDNATFTEDDIELVDDDE